VKTRATRNRILALAAACAASLAVAACGSDEEGGDPIPSDVAARLEQRLNVVEAQFKEAGGACEDLQNETFQVIEQDLQSLPEDVDPDVRRALEESFVRLRDLSASECDDEKGQETTPTETETTPTETETTPTETETTPTEPETTPTGQEEGPGKDKKEKKKDEENEGGGQGGAGGQGGGAPAPGDDG
jgi:hypothetical protein